jgi:hypothetical protein
MKFLVNNTIFNYFKLFSYYFLCFFSCNNIGCTNNAIPQTCHSTSFRFSCHWQASSSYWN